MNPSPSITEIAHALSLDKSTVSRALRGDTRVKKLTIDRVTKYAREQGYQRNPTLSALSEIRWRKQGNRALMNWAFLVSEIGMRYPENQIFLDHCKHYAGEAGYILNEIILTPKTTAKVLSRMISARNIRGVIVNHLYRESSVRSLKFSEIKSNETKWVYCGNFFFEPEGLRVVENAFANTTVALEKVEKKGYQNIAIIYPAIIRESRDMVRYRAASTEFMRNYPKINISLIELTDYNDPLLYSDSLQKVEVLLLSYMIDRERLPTYLHPLPFVDLLIPRGNPDYSGISRVHEEFAQTSVDLLDFQCRRFGQGLDTRPYTILVEGKWQDGCTLPLFKNNSIR